MPQSAFGALLAMLVALTGLSQPSPAAQRSAAGEIIVKFSPESEAGSRVARAASGTALPTTDVIASVNVMARELGVPLEVRRLGSGGAVVLAIRAVELSEMLAKRIRRQPFVKSARLVPATATAASAVRVELVRGTAEARTLSRKSTDLEHRQAVDAIADQLERASGVALIGHVNPADQLILTPQLDEVTRQVVERLGKRADVEYAQLNYTNRPVRRIQ